ncbi:MAG: ABC transporter substrate-binding protein [Candidatus Promineofilum sp.]|nr:ABC transporter substrate-binding protein [Promineifilum sp.]
MSKNAYTFLIAALIVLALAVAGCQPAESATMPSDVEVAEDAATPAAEEPAAQSAAADPLIVLIDNDEGPITPANFNTFIGYYLVGWVYDPLFARTPELGVTPALATEYSVSEDGLTWTVQLRDDVTWHDGEPFTADDVVFSYNFLVDAGRAPNLTTIESIEASGDHEVVIQLASASPFFLREGLAGYFILPEHIWRDQEPISGELSQFQGQIGTGPYRLGEIVPGESYTFTANPDYFRGPPTVPNLIAKIVKDRTQQFNQLRTGTAHAVLSSVPPAQVEQLASDPAIELAKGSDFFNYIFYMNGSRPPFDQPEVRQAIAKAIDARMLVDTVMLGQGVELPLSWYHPEVPWSINVERAFDPAAAQSLLDTAGLVDSDGDGVREFNGEPTAFEILCDTNNPVEVRSTELIVGMLADVGIGASQKCLDIDTAVTFIWPNFVAVAEPEYDMAIWGWSSGTQFQQGFVSGLLHSDFGGIGWANLTGVADPEMDALLTALSTSAGEAEADAASKALQERIAATLPYVPLMSPGGNFAYRPEAYDGWVYMNGTGIMSAWSFLPANAAE